MDALPLLQSRQLWLCVEPMLPLRQDGQVCPAVPAECLDDIIGSHVIRISVKNLCGRMPMDRVFPHPAEIAPGKGLSKVRWDLPCLLLLRFRHVGPLHHLPDEIFHIHHRRDKERLFQLFF